MKGDDGIVKACLAGVALALLLVGVVSGTPVRHVVQIVPLLAALGVAMSGVSWAPYVARPVFAFWFLIMLGIWLFLLGVGKIITGRFTPTEVALTVVIGVSSLVGILATLGRSSSASMAVRVGAFAAFGILQVVAIWLSMRPEVARR